MLQFSNKRKCTSWTHVNPFQISFINSQLRTGSIPNVQRERVLALTEGLEADVSGCYQDILETKRILAELEHSYQLLTNLLGRTQSIVSPIRKLPIEILQEIFEHYMSQWEYSLTIGHCCKHDVVLPITQVCSHWREIAHSIPGLWASISVDLDFFRHGSLDISHIKQHLSRSRHVPLKIAVRGSPMSIGDIPFSKAEQLWMMLLEYSQTWNTLKLFVSNQSFLQASRFLALKGKDPFPNLRSITMPDMSNLHLLSVNFKRLTYLELSFYSGTSLEELFDSCNLLEVCILGGYRCEDPDKDANARPRILTHHHLRELHLRSEKNCSPHALLTLFFPNLKKLCLHKNTSYAHPHPAEIVALLRRESGGLPRCSLQSLHLAGYDGESADSILSSVQDSISTLSVHDYYCFLPDHISVGLSKKAFPRLQTLEITGDGSLEESEQAPELVCALVESRYAPGPNRSVIGLQRFKFTLNFSQEWAELCNIGVEDDEDLELLELFREKRTTLLEVIRTRLAPLVDAGLSLEVKVVGFPGAEDEDQSASEEDEEASEDEEEGEVSGGDDDESEDDY